MRIIAAVFIDTIQLREVPGPSTRIDLGGVKFSEVAPSAAPVTLEPHLVVLVYCPKDHKAEAALEVTYTRDGEQVARNVQMLACLPIDPAEAPRKFAWRRPAIRLYRNWLSSIAARKAQRPALIAFGTPRPAVTSMPVRAAAARRP